MKFKQISIIFVILIINSIAYAEIAIIKWKDITIYNQAIEGFKQTVNSDYTIFDCQGNKDEVEKILSNINSYNVIFIVGEIPLKQAIKKSITKPIVYAMVYNPQLIVKNMENITGASLNISFNTQFAIIKEVLPQAKKIGFLYSRDELIEEADKLAKLFEFNLKKIKVNSAIDISKGLASLNDCDLIMMISDPILSSRGVISAFLLFGMENKIPINAISDKLVKSGALFALTPNFFENGKIAADLVNKIILENKIPIAQGMNNGDLWLNLKVAKDMEIKISSIVINEAKGVFE